MGQDPACKTQNKQFVGCWSDATTSHTLVTQLLRRRKRSYQTNANVQFVQFVFQLAWTQEVQRQQQQQQHGEQQQLGVEAFMVVGVGRVYMVKEGHRAGDQLSASKVFPSQVFLLSKLSDPTFLHRPQPSDFHLGF